MKSSVKKCEAAEMWWTVFDSINLIHNVLSLIE